MNTAIPLANKEFFVAIGEDKRGPLSLPQIYEGLKNETIPKDALCSFDGAYKWFTMTELRELHAAQISADISPLSDGDSTYRGSDFLVLIAGISLAVAVVIGAILGSLVFFWAACGVAVSLFVLGILVKISESLQEIVRILKRKK